MHHPEMQRRPRKVRDLVVELREKLKLNQSQFAAKLKVSQPTVSRWEAGTDEPEYPALRTLATIAGCRSVDEFLGFPTLISGVNLNSVPVVGAVEAGVWQEAIEWPFDQQFAIQVPEDNRFPGIPRRALQVKGPSMNRYYPDGSFVIVVSYLDLARDPLPGEKVVCQRRDKTGQVEATIKEYVLQDGRHYLWPRSDHPDHQAPILLEAVPEDEELRITARVTGKYAPE